MKASLILVYFFINNAIFSQEKIDNSRIVIDKIKTQLTNEKINDFFFYSLNCYADVASPIDIITGVSVDGVSKTFLINEFRLYCFWTKNNEFFIQKFDNTTNDFNDLNISKAIKIENFNGFKIISENFEKIKKEKILDAEVYFEGKLGTIDVPIPCVWRFEIFNDKKSIHYDFLRFKIIEKSSINYKKNQQLNIVKLYHQCEQKINNLELQNSFTTTQKEKILE